VLSVVISLNHKAIVINNITIDADVNLLTSPNPCVTSTKVSINPSKDMLVERGHGDGVTKWKGCA